MGIYKGYEKYIYIHYNKYIEIKTWQMVKLGKLTACMQQIEHLKQNEWTKPKMIINYKRKKKSKNQLLVAFDQKCVYKKNIYGIYIKHITNLYYI